MDSLVLSPALWPLTPRRGSPHWGRTRAAASPAGGRCRGPTRSRWTAKDCRRVWRSRAEIHSSSKTTQRNLQSAGGCRPAGLSPPPRTLNPSQTSQSTTGPISFLSGEKGPDLQEKPCKKKTQTGRRYIECHSSTRKKSDLIWIFKFSNIFQISFKYLSKMHHNLF